jgi:2-amino-4-hydroxy-6-hydroxymethyldihydropteridine diphosphokinase
MILVALGSNRNGPWGNPEQTVERALAALDGDGLRLLRASRLLVSSAFGRENQPDFVNAVAAIATHLPPPALLARLHAIEREAGRKRSLRWGPRTLDLDLLAYHGLVRRPPSRPALPHPGIAERLFVLKPLAEIAPRWRHPVNHLSARTMMRVLRQGGAGDEV